MNKVGFLAFVFTLSKNKTKAGNLPEFAGYSRGDPSEKTWLLNATKPQVKFGKMDTSAQNHVTVNCFLSLWQFHARTCIIACIIFFSVFSSSVSL